MSSNRLVIAAEAGIQEVSVSELSCGIDRLQDSGGSRNDGNKAVASQAIQFDDTPESRRQFQL